MSGNKNLRERANQLKSDIPAVFLSLKNKDTPVIAKIIAGITVVYALSPIDLIPDFIPVLGYLDDVILLPFLVALTIKCIPTEVLEQCRIEAKDMWQNKKHKKWYYAIPILIIWAGVIWLIMHVNLFFDKA